MNNMVYYSTACVDALEQQKVHFERQLAELRDRLQDVEVGDPVVTSPPIGTIRHNRSIFSHVSPTHYSMQQQPTVIYYCMQVGSRVGNGEQSTSDG